MPTPYNFGLHDVSEATTLYCQGAFLARRDWRAGKMEWLLQPLLIGHPMIGLVRGGLGRARSIARRLCATWRMNLVLYTAQLIEVWFHRPAGLDWAVNHHTPTCGPANPNPTEDTAVNWPLWFNLQGPAGGPEHTAQQDLYKWCTKPYNVIQVWRDTIDYLDPAVILYWAQNRHLLAANPQGLPAPLAILEGLRDVVRYLIKPVFEHLRRHPFQRHRRFTFGRHSDIYRSLYMFDRFTVPHTRELDHPANCRSVPPPRQGRHDWMDALDDEIR
jgi:hypothetical protein